MERDSIRCDSFSRHQRVPYSFIPPVCFGLVFSPSRLPHRPADSPDSEGAPPCYRSSRHSFNLESVNCDRGTNVDSGPSGSVISFKPPMLGSPNNSASTQWGPDRGENAPDQTALNNGEQSDVWTQCSAAVNFKPSCLLHTFPRPRPAAPLPLQTERERESLGGREKHGVRG